MPTWTPAMNGLRWLPALFAGLLDPTSAAVSPAQAQSACTTNYCIRSQSLSYQTPPGWPAVPIQSCCKTDWGAVPDGIDWSNGAPIMICTGNADYTTFPNCGDPKNLSQIFPLHYDKPRIGIGAAWPSSKDYRYELQAIPITDGADGSCAAFSNQPGKVTNWWVHDLKEPRRGAYVFTATVSFQRDDKGYYAVLNSCKLAPPASTGGAQ